MDSNIATQRKGAGGKKLRTNSFEKCITKIVYPAVVLEELLNESSNKLSSEMVSDLRDCSLKVEDETKTNFTDQEVYLREIIDNNNKKNHKLEQVIKELKRQLQDTQRDALNKRLFNFEKCKSEDSNAAFILAFEAGTL